MTAVQPRLMISRDGVGGKPAVRPHSSSNDPKRPSLPGATSS